MFGIRDRLFGQEEERSKGEKEVIKDVKSILYLPMTEKLKITYSHQYPGEGYYTYLDKRFEGIRRVEMEIDSKDLTYRKIVLDAGVDPGRYKGGQDINEPHLDIEFKVKALGIVTINEWGEEAYIESRTKKK